MEIAYISATGSVFLHVSAAGSKRLEELNKDLTDHYTSKVTTVLLKQLWVKTTVLDKTFSDDNMQIAWFVAHTNVAIGGNEHVIDIFNIVMIWKTSHCIFSILLSKGGGTGG